MSQRLVDLHSMYTNCIVKIRELLSADISLLPLIFSSLQNDSDITAVCTHSKTQLKLNTGSV
uniref:Uncharacterized protein n=1 Tax=Arundo donax TaxID=35708 RepID=A0A0A9DWE6_ARUDO